ncbi:RtcB family protein [Limnoglobus roseus]|uniref:tRNA-splicing ligase RtcB n=1 Tax=Limnoglobus roseus TaxID=2598579 RepID=A0A5C1AMT8_9BACT|nr:RtcB family protein [Limnoglobus roseus]QEL19042.1 RtcB family protein [Limnoglobus roseus]
MKERFNGPLERVDSCCVRIPKSYKAGMRVDGMIFANERLMEAIREGNAADQVANVATLPGIQGASLAMPDIHWGYGFCIGGVCATDPLEGGVISPGGVGYDINCGVRLVKTNLFWNEIKPHVRELVKALFYSVPSGVGRTGKYKFDAKETRRLMGQGPQFVVNRDCGVPKDLEYTEANGFIADGDPDQVTDHAVKRGSDQCGTLGSGNHFMEVQVVDAVVDAEVAKVFGLELNQVCVMIHSGSRGLGYQVCDDALSLFRNLDKKYGIDLPDRQLACAPAESPEGKKYIAAMRAAANYGFCNRQLLMQQAREVFAHVFGRTWQDLEMHQLYDVAHNIAKLEEHTVDGKKKKVWVHRKGATRAFPAGHPEVPEQFRHVGQPVIIPGDMGRASWVLVGAPGSMEKTFGTTCHGAGRAMSRTAAVKAAGGKRIDKELESRGVIAMASSRLGLAEEQPNAYKNVDHVVEVVHDADLSRKVARMRPIGVIKG